MFLILQEKKPDDFIIATGETYSLEDFVRFTFEYLNLDWQKNVIIDENLFRPADLTVGKGNPTKAKTQLNWQAKYKTKEIVTMMIKAKLA